jgi:uncharacterized membrane protein HdeD (DUF308 family)
MNGDMRSCLSGECIKQIKEHSIMYLWLGISLVVLGMLAIMFSFVSTILSMVYLGAILIVVGLFEGFKALKVRSWNKFFFMHLALGILYIAAGAFVIAYPIANAVMLTLLWAAFFVVSGLMRIVFAFAKHIPHKSWIVANGIMSVLLGLLIWWQWPLSGLWVIGMFIGIDMIMIGWSWIMLSSVAKRLGA